MPFRYPVKKSLCFFTPLLFILAYASSFSCNYGQNADKIARALADRLNGAMSFDNATDHPADELPDPNKNPDQAPQVAHIEGSMALSPGQQFKIVVQAKFSDLGQVDGAIVYIQGSSVFYTINASIDVSTGLMTISGWMSSGDSLDMIRQRSFELKIGFYRTDPNTNAMVAGTYKKWSIAVAGRGEAAAMADDICTRFCNYLDKCGILSSPDSGLDQPGSSGYSMKNCIDDCTSSKEEIYSSNQWCVSGVNTYTDCILNMSCDEFYDISVNWFENEDNPCRIAYDQMEQNCKNESWWQSYAESSDAAGH
ncbi:MAG: hypothetical protein GXP49_04370 [Deltaproteobacteria bacterium]|nr:hypothetical protein [Deltaproteobacteria bacterium]